VTTGVQGGLGNAIHDRSDLYNAVGEAGVNRALRHVTADELVVNADLGGVP
jgi:hypothetical protein